MSSRAFVLVVFLIAFAVRVAIALAWPSGGGDTKIYLKVAENIFSHGCVSLSDPGSGDCQPHWGGNQLPGYPAFVAAIWWLTGHSNTAILIGQAAANALAIAYLGAILFHWLGDIRRTALAIGIVVLSPIGLPWSRYLLTEGLSNAITIWIAAEILRSLAERRLRAVPLGVAFALAVFVRNDNVLLAAPIAITAFALHGWTDGLRRGLIAALIAGLPLGAWWARSVHARLPIAPNVYTMPGDFRTPIGYLAWGRTWATNEYQAPAWIHPIYGQCYSCIRIPNGAYSHERERDVVETLLREIATQDGRGFPADVDAAFALLAAEKRSSDPARHYLLVPMLRIAWLFFNPFQSNGWPVELGTRPAVYALGAEAIGEIIMAQPGTTAVKASTSLYRMALVLFVLISVLRLRRVGLISSFSAVAFVYLMAQAVFHASLGMSEGRYMVGALVLAEISAALAISDFARRRQR